MSSKEASSARMFSSSQMALSRVTISGTAIRRKSNRWHRDRMVGRTLWGSVVAKMKSTWGGGSSRVFSKALNAAVESICTSSTMYTLRRAPCGGMRTVSRRSRISSTRLFEAASISITFRLRPSSNVRQCSQARHGSASLSRSFSGVVQLMAFARMRAAVVLPTPRGPLNR